MSYIELSSLGAGVAQYQSGAVVAGKPGTIIFTGTSNPVPIYPTPGGVADLTGDFVTDAFGRVPGWVLRQADDFYVDISVPPADPVTVMIPGTGDDPDGIIGATQQPGDYTFALSDLGTVVEGTSANPQTYTVPTDAHVAFPVGSLIEVYQAAAGQIVFVGEGGVTLETLASRVHTAGQGATAGLRKRSANRWVLSGALS